MQFLAVEQKQKNFSITGIKRWTESEKYGKICIRNDIMKSEVGGYTHENCNH